MIVERYEYVTVSPRLHVNKAIPWWGFYAATLLVILDIMEVDKDLPLKDKHISFPCDVFFHSD